MYNIAFNLKRLLSTLLLVSCFFASIAHSQNAVKSWVFKHKTTQLTRTIQQGKPITIKWQGLSKEITTSGILLDINADSTLLDLKGTNANIPNNRIIEIRTKKKPNVLAGLLAGALLSIGLVSLLVILIVELFAFRSVNENFNPGKLLLYTIFVYLGILIMVRQSKPLKVYQPFKTDWIVQEQSPDQKSNVP